MMRSSSRKQKNWHLHLHLASYVHHVSASAMLSLGTSEFGVSFLAALTSPGVNLEAATVKSSQLELV